MSVAIPTRGPNIEIIISRNQSRYQAWSTSRLWRRIWFVSVVAMGRGARKCGAARESWIKIIIIFSRRTGR